MEQQQNGAEKVQNSADSLRLHFKRMEIIAGGGVYTHTYQWLNAHKITYPKFLFWSAVAGVGIFMAAIAAHIVSTGFGLVAESILFQVGYGVGIVMFIALFGKMFIDTWQAGAYVAHTWNENKPEQEAKVLATGSVWQPPSLGVDTLICLLPGETLASFHEREKAARAATSYAIWAAILPPFQNAAAIYTAEEETDFIFTRGDEPFLNPDAPDYVDRRAWDHSDETYQAYTQYVEFFAPRFVKFAEQKKLVVKQERASRTFFEINAAKALTAPVCFLLFCLPVFGQSKARQVDEVLGTRIREIPKAGEKVTFVFREGSKDKYYERTGDGKSEYTDLLQKTSGLVKYNDQGGELVAIMKNGEAIAKAAHVERVNEVPKQQSPVAPNGAVYLPPNNTGDPIRPRGTLQGPDVANTPVTDEPTRYHFPDSSATAATLEDAKEVITGWKGKAWEQIQPIWRFVLWVFSSLVILLICLIGLCRYVAKSAANESVVNTYGRVIVGGWIARAQQEAASMTLFLTWIIAIVVLIDVFMWLIMLDLPIWTLVVIWFPILYAAEKLTDWIVPNANIVGIEKALNPYNKP